VPNRKDSVKGRKLFSQEPPDKVAWLLRGQQPPEAAETAFNSFDQAAARARANLSPEDKERLAKQEKETNAFVRRRPGIKRPEIKKESTMKTLRKVILEAKRNSSGRKAQAKYARRHPNSDVAKRVAARAHGAKPNSAGLENDFIGRFKPKEGQHARHMQTGQTASQRQASREIEDYVVTKPGRIKDRQSVRRGQKVDPPSEHELDSHIKRGRANKPPRRRGDKVVRGGVYDNTAYPLTANRVFMFEARRKNTVGAQQRQTIGREAARMISQNPNNKADIVKAAQKVASERTTRVTPRLGLRSNSGRVAGKYFKHGAKHIKHMDAPEALHFDDDKPTFGGPKAAYNKEKKKMLAGPKKQLP